MAKFQTSQRAPLPASNSGFADLPPKIRVRRARPQSQPTHGQRFDLVSVVLVVMILLTLFIFIL